MSPLGLQKDRCPVCNNLYTKEDMVECTECGNWTHYVCAGVGDEVANDVRWKCVNCVEAGLDANHQSPAGTNKFPTKAASTTAVPTSSKTISAGILRRTAAEFVSSGISNTLKSFVPVSAPALNLNTEGVSGAAPTSIGSYSHRAHKEKPICSSVSVREQLRLLQEEQELLKRQQILVQRRQELIQQLSIQEEHQEKPTQKKIGVAEQVHVQTQELRQPKAAHTTTQEFHNAKSENPIEAQNYQELTSRQLMTRQAIAKDLPTFTGNPSEWPIFFSSYKQTTAACGFSDYENLIRLQRCLKGKAREVVEAQLTMPDCIDNIIDTLQMLFGRPELVMGQQIQKLRTLPGPKLDKMDSVINFAMAVKNLCSTLTQAMMEDHLRNPMLMQELQEKLPPTMKMSWAERKRYASDPNNLCTLAEWLNEIAMDVCSVTTISSWIARESLPQQKGRKEMQNFYQHQEVSSSEPHHTTTKVNNNKCKVCSGTCRNVSSCKKFTTMDVDDRWSFIRAQRLCRECLKKHQSKCHTPTRCDRENCKRNHHPLLHTDQSQVSRYQAKEAAMSHQTRSPTGIHFRVIPVILASKGKHINTTAFLDEGSTSTLIAEDIAEHLGLEGINEPLCLKWTGTVSRTEEQSRKVDVVISGVHRNAASFTLTNVRTVSLLNLPAQSLNYPKLAAKYSHLRNLPVTSYDKASPGILIGLRSWKVPVPLKVKEGADDEPMAIKCRLGWTIFCKMGDKIFKEVTGEHSYHICECHNEDEGLHELVKQFFPIDNLGVVGPSNELQEQEEKRARSLLNSSTTYIGNRYKTGLLWRYENFKLPDSRPMAMQRLRCLERRLKSDPALADSMKQQIKQYQEKGYVHKLSRDELLEPRERVWYLPIFPVRNPNKPDKMRIVWDAAAKVDGVSLNTLLMKGIDLNSSLFGVLLRSRERRVCIATDIKEMYHQVCIVEQDQHVLRFLWRDADETREPDTYVMRVMTFGATCSPSSAQYIKNINALKYEQEYPRAVKCIIDNHYVDDLLDSVDTDEEAVCLANQVSNIHHNAGFKIRNWMSNSIKVMQALNPNSSNADVNMQMNSRNSTEKILGMWWCLSSDEFTYSLRYNKGNQAVLNGEERPSKRELLKILMSIYDPLGLISHFLVYAKILLQEVWKSHIDWDDPIPDEQFEAWLQWLKVLKNIERVKIPRCYLKDLPNWSDVNAQLHIYVDASEQAYAAVAYLRIESGSKVLCSLVAAKTKVAPIKLRSVPRLELDAAILGCRLAKNIQEQL